MALDANATLLANLINPTVYADYINTKLTDAIKFSKFFEVDNTLVGTAGSTLRFPKYAYIGDATVVGEGVDINIAQLSASSVPATIHKVGIGVQITDEAILSGLGNPREESARQIIHSIANAVDNEILATMETAPIVYNASTAFSADVVANALELFGEDEEEGQNVLLVAPEMKTVLRTSEAWVKATDVGAQMIVDGMVGEIHGCQIVVSNKLKGKKEAFIVKVGATNPAGKLVMKRDTLVETDRDIINKTNVITADKHFATHLYDGTKLVKITVQ